MPRATFDFWKPSVLVCPGKVTTVYLPAFTEEQAHEQALLLLQGRVNNGTYYNTGDEDGETWRRDILARKDGAQALTYLRSRRAEYEQVDLEVVSALTEREALKGVRW